jgi:hypothetical protein
MPTVELQYPRGALGPPGRGRQLDAGPLELFEDLADELAVGAEHGPVEGRAGQQLEHAGGGALDPQGLVGLDRPSEPAGQRLDGLEAALGRAGDDPAQRAAAQPVDQPQRLLASLGRQGAGQVGARPMGLLARVGVPHEVDHGTIQA